MNNKQFLQACDLIKKNLVNEVMDRTFNSIGSNVFFQFGKGKEIISRNGRTIIEKEWSIRAGNASWRISKKSEYVTGSGDSPQIIQFGIQKLLGKRFQSFQFLSQFLDVEFNFEDGYQITTFFNWLMEDQWTVCLPNDLGIGIDCSTYEKIKQIQALAKHIPIIETYKKLDFLPPNITVTKIAYNEYDLPIFHFENGNSLHLEICTWRLEKHNDYLIGYLDEDKNQIRDRLSELVGKKLKQIDIANPMMDARFQFEDDYVLKTFTCCRAVKQWKICKQNELIFSADIQISNAIKQEK